MQKQSTIFFENSFRLLDSDKSLIQTSPNIKKLLFQRFSTRLLTLYGITRTQKVKTLSLFALKDGMERQLNIRVVETSM